jgi:hypothetical protein
VVRFGLNADFYHSWLANASHDKLMLICDTFTDFRIIPAQVQLVLGQDNIPEDDWRSLRKERKVNSENISNN